MLEIMQNGKKIKLYSFLGAKIIAENKTPETAPEAPTAL